jgi:hypothetical protein
MKLNRTSLVVHGTIAIALQLAPHGAQAQSFPPDWGNGLEPAPQLDVQKDGPEDILSEIETEKQRDLLRDRGPIDGEEPRNAHFQGVPYRADYDPTVKNPYVPTYPTEPGVMQRYPGPGKGIGPGSYMGGMPKPSGGMSMPGRVGWSMGGW